MSKRRYKCYNNNTNIIMVVMVLRSRSIPVRFIIITYTYYTTRGRSITFRHTLVLYKLTSLRWQYIRTYPYLCIRDGCRQTFGRIFIMVYEGGNFFRFIRPSNGAGDPINIVFIIYSMEIYYDYYQRPIGIPANYSVGHYHEYFWSVNDKKIRTKRP